MENSKEYASLQEYMLMARKKMELPGKGRIHIVTGNEACDLDSAVSALVYALHLWKTDSANSDTIQAVVVPMLNIPREDYVLKTEVVYALKKQGIEQSDLLFADDVDPVRLHQEDRLLVTLVDHHVPVGSFATLTDAVKEVIDHRIVEHGEKTTYLRSIETTLEIVGSCSTLIAEKLFSDLDPKSLTPVTAFLLYETIILDTVNFSKKAHKATPKDEQIADRLQRMLPTAPIRDHIFSELTDAKADISRLNTDQLLRKDLKILEIRDVKLAVASVPQLARQCLNGDESQAEIETFCRKYSYTGLVVLGISMKDCDVQRDMLCFAPDVSYVDLLLDELCNNSEGKLGLERDPCFRLPDGRYQYFKQGNVKASRKQILPLLRQIIEQKLADMQSTGLVESPPRPSSRCGPLVDEDSSVELNSARDASSGYYVTEPHSPHGMPPKAAKRLGEMVSPPATPPTSTTDNADGVYESHYQQITSDSSIDTENSENDMLSLEEALALSKDKDESRKASTPASFLRPFNIFTPNGPTGESPFHGSDSSMDTQWAATPDRMRERRGHQMDDARGDVLDGGTPITPGTGAENENNVGWSSIPISPATPVQGQRSRTPLNLPAEEEKGDDSVILTTGEAECAADLRERSAKSPGSDTTEKDDNTGLSETEKEATADETNAAKGAVGAFYAVTGLICMQNSNRQKIPESDEKMPSAAAGSELPKLADTAERMMDDILENMENSAPFVHHIDPAVSDGSISKKRFLDEVDGEPAKKFAHGVHERSDPSGIHNRPDENAPYARPKTPTPLDGIPYNSATEFGNLPTEVAISSPGAHSTHNPRSSAITDFDIQANRPQSPVSTYPWSEKLHHDDTSSTSPSKISPEKFIGTETVSVRTTGIPSKLSLTILAPSGEHDIPPETGFEIYAGLSPTAATSQSFQQDYTTGNMAASDVFSLDPWLEKSEKDAKAEKSANRAEAKSFDIFSNMRPTHVAESEPLAEPKIDGSSQSSFGDSGSSTEARNKPKVTDPAGTSEQCVPQIPAHRQNVGGDDKLEQLGLGPFTIPSPSKQEKDQVDGYTGQAKLASPEFFSPLDDRWYLSASERPLLALTCYPLRWYDPGELGDQLDGGPVRLPGVEGQQSDGTQSFYTPPISDQRNEGMQSDFVVPPLTANAEKDMAADELVDATVSDVTDVEGEPAKISVDSDSIVNSSQKHQAHNTSHIMNINNEKIDQPDHQKLTEELVRDSSGQNAEHEGLPLASDSIRSDSNKAQSDFYFPTSYPPIQIAKPPLNHMSAEELRLELLGYTKEQSALVDAGRRTGQDVVDSAVKVKADVHEESSEPKEKKLKINGSEKTTRFTNSMLLKKTEPSFEYPTALSRLLTEADRNGPNGSSFESTGDTKSSSSNSETAHSPTAVSPLSPKMEVADQENIEPVVKGMYDNDKAQLISPRRISMERDEVWAVDMAVLEPYKKVLHICTLGVGRDVTDVVCFFACYLPSRTVDGYENIMQNIFRYFVSSLDIIVEKQCKVIFFNGGVPKNSCPRATWLHQCCRMIDRRIQRNIEKLIIVHPNFWFKTQLQTFGRATLSATFYRKIHYAENFDNLHQMLNGANNESLDCMRIPQEIVEYDLMLKAKKPGRRLSWEMFTKSSSVEEAK